MASFALIRTKAEMWRTHLVSLWSFTVENLTASQKQKTRICILLHIIQQTEKCLEIKVVP